MELYKEEALLEYVRYWGGNLDTLVTPDYRKGRGLAAVVFYCMHRPEVFPPREFWKRTIRQAVTFTWVWTHTMRRGYPGPYRTEDCLQYFELLLDGYIRQYGPLEVFKFRYQNWEVVNCELMADQLWTVQEMMKGTF